MTGWGAWALLAFVAAAVHALRTNAWREAIARGQTAGDVPKPITAPVSITVVVPARNAGTTLAALLQDLHAQELPAGSLQVLVVDDHSEDATRRIAEGMARSWPRLEIIRLGEMQGKKAAIAAGVEAATGEVVVITDADARCGPRRVASIAAHAAQHRWDLLLMPVLTHGDGFLGRLQQEEQLALLGALVGGVDEGRPMLANGANMAFRREAFRAVGGYAGDAYASGDDIFLVQRMRRSGRPIAVLLDREALVTVEATATWTEWWSQRLRWAGKMRGVRDPAGGALALFGLLLPWGLATLTLAMVLHLRMGQGLLFAWTLLLAAWGLWAVPLVQLGGDVHRFLGTDRFHSLRTFGALLAFTLYAPMIAIVALVARPRWKGRRT
jgi:cellulose synthase/poly-beta-1,6-N-acetylglucosamine synthase-like glycosyltransferase